jgi:hypothetical protein
MVTSGLSLLSLLRLRLRRLHQIVVLCVRDLPFAKPKLYLPFDLGECRPSLVLGPIHIHRCLPATQEGIHLDLALGFLLGVSSGLRSLHDTSAPVVDTFPKGPHSGMKSI